MIKIKTVSSLEKCFLDSDPDDFEQIDSISVLKNQRFSFQIIARPLGDDRLMHRLYAKFTASGCLAPFVSARTVEFIPSVFPCYPDNYDDNYLSTSPGLYPDLLLPAKDDTLSIIGGQTRALWLTAQLDGSIAGDRTLDFTLSAGDNVLFSGAIKVHIIDAELPPQTLINTQWFHSDCLSTYYDAPVFSDRWWTIVRNFVDVAVKNGQNMLLTPVFTPPLDTAVGGERPTVQLIDVYFDGKNYTFSYDNLDKWLNMANSAGIKYYEISHLFTQWGAACAPKIIAHTPEGTKRIFGWDTQASDEEYKTFLRRFIPDFLTHMKARGDDKRCFFHISDEPGADSLAVYMKSKKCVADLLDGYPVMDALSNIEFYKQGVIDRPVAAIDHIQPFIDEKVPDLWAYYCCGQCRGVSNRFFAMPSCRTRCIGFQLFKNDIAGFLHWGYNFYYSWCSREFVDPYRDSSGIYFTPSGDCYSVYPAPDGTAYESLRLVVFYDALQDLRACRLLADLIGKSAVDDILERHLGTLSFDNCPHSARPLLSARAAVNSAIEKALAKK